jgi:hypothetical protein
MKIHGNARRDDTAPSAINRPRLGSPSWNNVLGNYI